MSYVILIVVALVEVAMLLGGIYAYMSKVAKSSAGSELSGLQNELEARVALVAELEEIAPSLVDIEAIKKKALSFVNASESLKADKGRNTITAAELETVENRLRELEEIERELEASGLEAKEELKILKKKERDLLNRNDSLKQQIQVSLDQMAQIFKEIQMSAEMQEQVVNMKTELVTTQSKIDLLLLQIESANEQYFVYKQRYDALDIEYAQLYEKFSMSEGG